MYSGNIVTSNHMSSMQCQVCLEPLEPDLMVCLSLRHVMRSLLHFVTFAADP